jgi:hypothetical protein
MSETATPTTPAPAPDAMTQSAAALLEEMHLIERDEVLGDVPKLLDEAATASFVAAGCRRSPPVPPIVVAGIGDTVRYITADGQLRAAVVTDVAPAAEPPYEVRLALAILEPGSSHITPAANVPYGYGPGMWHKSARLAVS